MPTTTISVFIALTSHYLGIGPIIAFGMFVAVLVETWTGVKASRKMGMKFESFKFSRCILKVFIWISLVFITNCFALECEYRGGWVNAVGTIFFDIVRLSILVYFVIEYIISILENFAVLDGKPKTQFTDALQSFWTMFLDIVKEKFHSKHIEQ